MTAPVKFFSQEWVEQALVTERAAGEAVRKKFKNPATFTHVLAFDVADRPGVSTFLRYEEGRSVAWTTSLPDESEVWARFRATAEVWREAAEGGTPGAKLIMAGKIRLIEGSMKDAAENAEPFSLLVGSWGQVPTDWDA